MSIIRSPRKERNFTIIDNSILQNKQLSMKALGMLVRLLSRPDNWKTNSETLAREFNCGRDQIRSVLGELESFGYMVLNKYQDEKGQWKSDWTVHESPIDNDPKYEEPATGFPVFGVSGSIQRTDLQRTDTNCVLHEERSVYQKDTSFDKFWNAYPRKTNKGFARKVFNKLKPSEELLNKMLSALEQHKAGWTDPKYIPHPSTWLNGERWEDEVEQPMSAYQRMMRS